jgi:ATP-dependent Lon protease
MANTPTTRALPVLPLDDAVVLPGMVVPLDLADHEVSAAIEAARAEHPDAPELLLVPRPDGKYAAYGTLAVIEQTGRLRGGQAVAVVRGTRRAKIGRGTTGPGAALWVQAEILTEPAATARTRELADAYRDVAVRILQHRGAFQVVDVVRQIEDPAALADSAGYAPYLTLEQKVSLLETADPQARLETALGWAREHLAELEVAETIRNDVNDGMEKQQREFLLRRQLEAIRKELAELDGRPADEKDDYRARVEAADLPEKVREAALREVDKLERGSDQSPETGWLRTWLDTVLELPWNERTEDSYDIAAARAVLDADHAGLDDVKERIVEFLAVRKRRADRGLGVVEGRRSGAVLALVGPPGVGKTSLGESVARAMGRKFTRVALGGIRDEAEVRGHRRTYVGALPGRIVRAVKEAGTMNPVILLDEIDKVGADYRGDPTAALLEVLDPAQNHTFRDHYLEIELDLSDVVFLATANVLESIPGPLLDRMELVRLDGYTEDEKVTIARDHLLRRQLDRAGLTPEEVGFGDDALRRLAAEYTREAGVRDLERSIARVLRKVAAKSATGDVTLPVAVTGDSLRDYIGRPRHTPETAERTAVPGVATGLAVTGAGGEVLFVEASLADPETGATGVSLTGQLGDVMKESAQIALSYLRSHGAELELPVGDLKDRGVHIHVPAGAVPKDGPSAGVTMVTAACARRSGDDRRGFADRPGSAYRRGQAEASGRAARRSDHGPAARAQRAGSGRCAR